MVKGVLSFIRSKVWMAGNGCDNRHMEKDCVIIDSCVFICFEIFATTSLKLSSLFTFSDHQIFNDFHYNELIVWKVTWQHCKFICKLLPSIWTDNKRIDIFKIECILSLLPHLTSKINSQDSIDDHITVLFQKYTHENRVAS